MKYTQSNITCSCDQPCTEVGLICQNCNQLFHPKFQYHDCDDKRSLKMNKEEIDILVKNNMIVSTVMEIAHRFHYSIFLAGSRRFGWDNDNSDYDFIIRAKDSDDMMNHEFDDNYFRATTSRMVIGDEDSNLMKLLGADLILEKTDYPGAHFSSQLFGKKLDLILVLQNEFDSLRTNHEDIDNLLLENPILIDIMKQINRYKSVGQGKHMIYRGLRDYLTGIPLRIVEK